LDWYYKGQRVEKDGPLWEEAILDDLQEFEKRGLQHTLIAKIRTLLAGKLSRHKLRS
jgi:hypothetical protein